MNKTNIQLRCSVDLSNPKNSILRLKELFESAKTSGAKAVAITDPTMYAVQPALEKCPEDVKFIIGGLIYITKDYDAETPTRLQLEFLVKDDIGYHALCRIMTESQKHIFEDPESGIKYPMLTEEDLLKFVGKDSVGYGHLYILSGGVNGVLTGIVSANEDIREASAKMVQEYREVEGLLASNEKARADIEKLKDDSAKLKGKASIKAKEFSAREKELKKSEATTEQESLDFLKEKAEYTESVKKTQKRYDNMMKARRSAITENEKVIVKTAKLMAYTDEDAKKYLETKKKEIDALGEGIFDENQNETMIEKQMMRWVMNLGAENFVVEIQNHGTHAEKKYMYQLCVLAESYGAMIVATNSVYRQEKEQLETLKFINAMNSNSWEDAKEGEEEQYLKMDDELEEMITSCVSERFAETALDNREVIADNCHIELKRENHYPRFPAEADDDLENAYLECIA